MSAQITLHSLNGARISNRPTHERNYDIFYILLAGMSAEEKGECLFLMMSRFFQTVCSRL